MKIFVLGALTSPAGVDTYKSEAEILTKTMETLGREIARSGHNLLVCSPFPDSADSIAVRGAATSGTERKEPFIEFHLPDTKQIQSEYSKLMDSIGSPPVHVFKHQPPVGESAQAKRDSWVVAQLCAMESCDALVAIGGKLEGTMSLVLPVAESRKKPILPFSFLGGAAAQCYDRRRYQLDDRIGQRTAVLSDPKRVDEAIEVLEVLLVEQSSAANSLRTNRFFISYSKARPQEADFVETVLRRRNLAVFRDEREFGAGRLISSEIECYMSQCEVFIAVWCKEYACSPWCFDEMNFALGRHAKGKMSLWILCADETRIVPPQARGLLNYPVRSREELEGTLIKLLEGPASR